MEVSITDEELQSKVMEVSALLEEHGISTSEWGKGKAKTVEHLAREVIEGDTEFVVENDRLIRQVQPVHVDVRYKSPDGREFQLFEEKQVFKDGRVRERGLNGVSEKMKPGEDSLDCARRALITELGVTGSSRIEEIGKELEEQESSHSYPGLPARYSRYEMKTYLLDSEFKPSGYIEDQPDKTTYFVWK